MSVKLRFVSNEIKCNTHMTGYPNICLEKCYEEKNLLKTAHPNIVYTLPHPSINEGTPPPSITEGIPPPLHYWGDSPTLHYWGDSPTPTEGIIEGMLHTECSTEQQTGTKINIYIAHTAHLVLSKCD